MSPSLLRPARRALVVLLTGPLAVGGLLVAGSGVASAHVTVSSADAAPGGYGKMTFRVPNESDTASTVALRIQVPTDPPITSLRAQPVAGWTITMTETELAQPVEAHGESITSAVSVVEFRADPGTGIAPGEFQEFALSGGPLPDAESLTFNTVQTYSDGTEAAWIEPTVEGQAEPERPAPVLTLSEADGAADPAGHGAAAEDSETGDGTGASDSAGDSATDSAADGDGDGLAVTALVVGIVGLLAGGAGLALGLAARRRTVSS